MMKKKWMIRTGLILVALLGLFFLSMVITRVEKKIIISSAAYEVSEQLSNIQNYRDWYPGINNGPAGMVASSAHVSRSFLMIKPDFRLNLQTLTPVSFILTEQSGNKEFVQSLQIAPAADATQTQVVWSREIPIYLRVANFFTGRDNMEEGLINLKARMEDPARKYGFEIALVPVSDTIILTAKRAAPDTSRINTLQALYDTVQQYISQNHPAGAKDYYYVTASPLKNNQSEFAVGVPVGVPSIPGKNIEFLRLPAQGHVLTGKATIGRLNELYSAMNRYAGDQNLQKVAQQLEKYTVKPTMIAGSPEQPVELVFPVF